MRSRDKIRVIRRMVMMVLRPWVISEGTVQENVNIPIIFSWKRFREDRTRTYFYKFRAFILTQIFNKIDIFNDIYA